MTNGFLPINGKPHVLTMQCICADVPIVCVANSEFREVTGPFLTEREAVAYLCEAAVEREEIASVFDAWTGEMFTIRTATELFGFLHPEFSTEKKTPRPYLVKVEYVSGNAIVYTDGRSTLEVLIAKAK